MLEGYEENQRLMPKGGVVSVTRLARLFWLTVEVAVPDSLASLVFRHGLKLLYVFEALMILLGRCCSTRRFNSSVSWLSW